MSDAHIAGPTLIQVRRTDNFEIASLPTTTPEERKRLLSFVVCGGGPTGVETAAVSSGAALLQIELRAK